MDVFANLATGFGDIEDGVAKSARAECRRGAGVCRLALRIEVAMRRGHVNVTGISGAQRGEHIGSKDV